MNTGPCRGSAWSGKNLLPDLPNVCLRTCSYIQLSMTSPESLYVAIHHARFNIAALLRRSNKCRFA
jgi:hypothetical protein